MRRGAPPADNGRPRFRGRVTAWFSGVHTVPTLAEAAVTERSHGHDFRAEFVFETSTLVYPGVVVEDPLPALIRDHVTKRLAFRDLDRLVDRPATCEALAEHLALWFTGSARPPEHAELVSVTVTTGAGGFGEIVLPPRVHGSGAR